MKVFISWSGPASRIVASALYEWLPVMIQRVRPWMSAEAIHAGQRWASEVSAELEASDFGIICITPINLGSPWLNFEAGALGKVATRSRVVPYLLDMEKSDVDGPLTQFQMVLSDEEGTYKMLQSVNAAVDDESRLSAERLRQQFEAFWPKIDERLDDARKALADDGQQQVTRSELEILNELLELARAQERRARRQERTFDTRNGWAQLAPQASNLFRSKLLTREDIIRAVAATAEGDDRIELLRMLDRKDVDEDEAAAKSAIDASADDLPGSSS